MLRATVPEQLSDCLTARSTFREPKAVKRHTQGEEYEENTDIQHVEKVVEFTLMI